MHVTVSSQTNSGSHCLWQRERICKIPNTLLLPKKPILARMIEHTYNITIATRSKSASLISELRRAYENVSPTRQTNPHEILRRKRTLATFSKLPICHNTRQIVQVVDEEGKASGSHL